MHKHINMRLPCLQAVAQAAQDAGTHRDAVSMAGRDLEGARRATGFGDDGTLQIPQDVVESRQLLADSHHSLGRPEAVGIRKLLGRGEAQPDPPS